MATGTGTTPVLDAPRIAGNGAWRSWGMVRDEKGHREYKIVFRVEGERTPGIRDGPYNALTAVGLPQPGDTWDFDDDVDPFARCKWNANVSEVVLNAQDRFFDIEYTFSTKPEPACTISDFEDPLLVPEEITITFVKYQEEATKDRHGEPIVNSAHEQLRGPQVEFDANRPRVRIKSNHATHDVTMVAQMMDTVNDSELWGCPARTIKLSDAIIEKKCYADGEVYYERTLEFDIRYRRVTGVGSDPTLGTATDETSIGGRTAVYSGSIETFDRRLLDEGTKVLNGRWDPNSGDWIKIQINGEEPDPDNPQHFIRFKDRRGENTRVILNGAGLPAGVNVQSAGEPTGTGTATGTVSTYSGDPGEILVEKYGESDFLLLGIPPDF